MAADILMREDEAGLGTPQEDLTSVAAVANFDVAQKLIVLLGLWCLSFSWCLPRAFSGERRGACA
jgi:hypothetical protein